MAKQKVKPVRVHRTAYATKNQPDLTLRNNRVSRRVEHALAVRLGALEQRVAKLEKAAAPKPWRGSYPGSKKLTR